MVEIDVGVNLIPSKKQLESAIAKLTGTGSIGGESAEAQKQGEEIKGGIFASVGKLGLIGGILGFVAKILMSIQPVVALFEFLTQIVSALLLPPLLLIFKILQPFLIAILRLMPLWFRFFGVIADFILDFLQIDKINQLLITLTSNLTGDLIEVLAQFGNNIFSAIKQESTESIGKRAVSAVGAGLGASILFPTLGFLGGAAVGSSAAINIVNNINSPSDDFSVKQIISNVYKSLVNYASG